MFESAVCDLLNKYLGDYVEGLDRDALSISVWKGDVVLNNLKLKTDALKQFNLPVTVSAGFLGSLRLKVPWASLGKEPVIVELDRIFLLAVPDSFSEDDSSDFAERERRAKHEAVDRGEKGWLELMASKTKQGSSDGDEADGKQTYVKAYIETILGNLQVSISNIHIRYEDFTTSSNPFRAGITLDHITAFTVDDAGERTFVASGALDRLLKIAQMSRLAVYFDTDVSDDQESEKLRKLPTEAWDEFFMPGIRDDGAVEGRRQFVVPPLNCELKYKRLGAREMKNVDDHAEAKQAFQFKLDTVRAQLSEIQVRDLRRLLDFIAAEQVRTPNRDLRPRQSPVRNPRGWWQYAVAAVKRQFCIRKLSWNEISILCHRRREYCASFHSLLKLRETPKKSKKENDLIEEFERDIQKMEEDLSVDVAVWFRVLVHMQIIRDKKMKAMQEAKAKAVKSESWTSWFSYVKSQPSSTTAESDEQTKGILSRGEQEELDRLMNVEAMREEAKNDTDDPYRLLMAIDVVVNKVSLHLLEASGDEILLAFTKLTRSCVSVFPTTTDVTLYTEEYGINMPAGLLLQAGTGTDTTSVPETLAFRFTSNPQDKSDVDSALKLTMAPTFVTFEKSALDRLQQFVTFGSDDEENNNLAALEAAAVQRLGDVAGQAQEQVMTAFNKKSRFEIDLDISAPKIALPVRSPEGAIVEHLLLDLGQFKLVTMALPDGSSEEEKAMYERVKLSGQRLCVFSAGPAFSWESASLESPRHATDYILEKLNFSVHIDSGSFHKNAYIELPSSRIYVDIPAIKVHFSPARYVPIQHLIESFSDTGDDESKLAWASPDFQGPCSILRKDGFGIGGAYQWLDKFAVVKADKLYILDDSSSSSCFGVFSIGIGRKALMVPEDTIGAPFVIAVADADSRGFNTVLVNKTSLIMKFESKSLVSSWMSIIRGTITRFTDTLKGNDKEVEALQRTSTLARMDSVSSITSSVASQRDDVFLECKLSMVEASLYVQLDRATDAKHEDLVVVIRALGSLVKFCSRVHEMDIDAALTSMSIEDVLKGRRAASKQFLLQPFDEAEAQTALSRMESSDVFFDAEEELTSPMRSRSSSGVGPGPSVMRFVMTSRAPESENFGGVITEVSVILGAVLLSCHRPTVSALILFGEKMGSAAQVGAPDPASPETKVGVGEGVQQTVIHDRAASSGYVSFRLDLAIDRADLSLDYEDASNFAVLSLQNLQVIVNVDDARLKTNASLGNLRVSDGRVESSHRYKWVVDLLKPDSKSLVELEFTTYTAEERRDKGFSSVFRTKISRIRLVYLHRFFVSEMLEYIFAMLDAGGDSVQEVQDAAVAPTELEQLNAVDFDAVELDIILESPTILIPAHTDSDDFIEVQLGELGVTNSIVKYKVDQCSVVPGSRQTQDSSVVYDSMSIALKGSNFIVATEGVRGSPLIDSGISLSVELRRRLVGLSSTIPDIDVSLNISDIDLRMSQDEYEILVSSVSSNIFEATRIPSDKGLPQETENTDSRALADGAARSTTEAVSNTVPDSSSSNAAAASTDTSFRLTLGLSRVLLTLVRSDPICAIELDKLHVSVRMTAVGGMLIKTDIAALAIYDMRNSDDGLLDCPMIRPRGDPASRKHMNLLSLEYASGGNQDSINMQLQQLVVVAEMDFILTVAQFFVPTLFEVASLMPVPVRSGDIAPGEKDSRDILLDDHYDACCDIRLTAVRRILADSPRSKSFTFDGNGHSIYLPRVIGCTLHADKETADVPIIIVGHGKTLKFQNVTIHGASSLPYFTSLKQNSRISFEERDGVTLVEYDDDRLDGPVAGCLTHASSSTELSDKATESHPTTAASTLEQEKSFAFDLIASGLRLQLLESNSDSQDTVEIQMDLGVSYSMIEDSQYATVKFRGLEACTESAGSPAQHILEPADILIKYSSVQESIGLQITSSSLHMQISPLSLNLFSNLVDSVLLELTAQTKAITAQCYRFERIYPGNAQAFADTKDKSAFSVWRPVCPKGYNVFGDCCVVGNKPPLSEVYALNDASGYGARPVSFELLWMNQSVYGGSESPPLAIWRPIAPDGFCALGMVASCGSEPPPLDCIRCLREELTVSSCFGSVSTCSREHDSGGGGSFWTVENVGMTFIFSRDRSSPPPESELLDFRIPQNGLTCPVSALLAGDIKEHIRSESCGHIIEATDDHVPHPIDTVELVKKPTSSKIIRTIGEFNRLWWTKGSGSRRNVSVWRPILPKGCVSLGDCISTSYMPPPSTVILHKGNLMKKLGGNLISDAEAPPVQPPINFELIWRNDGMKGEKVFMWRPKPPPGYVALGCVATRTPFEPDYDVVSCVRIDLVIEKVVSVNDILWDNNDMLSSAVPNQASIWSLDLSASTFMVQSSFRPPEKIDSFELAIEEIEGCGEPLDKLSMDFNIENVSCQLFGGAQSRPMLEIELREPRVVVRGSAHEIQATLTLTTALYSFQQSLEVWEPVLEPTDFIVKFENVDELATGLSVPGMRLRTMATSEFNATLSETAVGVATEAARSFLSDVHSPLATSLEIMYDNQFGQQLLLNLDYRAEQPSIVDVPSGTQTSVPRALPKRIERAVEKRRAERHSVNVQVKALRGLDRTKHDNFGTEPGIIVCAFITGSEERSLSTPLADADGENFRWINGALSLDISSSFWSDEDIQMLNVELKVIDVSASSGAGLLLGRCDIEFSKKFLEKRIAARRSTDQVEYGESWVDLEETSASNTYEDVGLLVETSVIPASSLVEETDHHSNQNSTQVCAIATSKDGPWAHQPPLPEFSRGVHQKMAFVLDGDVVILEKGVKNTDNLELNLLRAAAVMKNALEVDVEVALSYPDDADLEFTLVKSATTSEVTEEIFENERFQPLIGWGSRYPGHLLPVDRRRYSSRSGLKSQQTFPKFSLPKGWKWVDEWSLCTEVGCDSDGWSYFFDFKSCTWPPPASAADRKVNHLVRRRRWVRHRVSEFNADGHMRQTATSADNVLPLGILSAGCHMALPGGCISKHNGASFLVRPLLDVECNWSEAVGGSQGAAVNDLGAIVKGSGYLACSKGSISRESGRTDQASEALKEEISAPATTSGGLNQLFWMSVDIHAEPLPTASMEYVNDYRILLNPIVLLDNSLPFKVTFSIFEKQRGDGALKHVTSISCAKLSTVSLNCIDPRRSTFMTIDIEEKKCVWPGDKAPVLIRDPLGRATEKLVPLTLQRNIGPDLRIQMQHSAGRVGGAVAATSRIKISAPVWIVNNTDTIVYFSALPKKRGILVENDAASSSGEKIPYLICAPVLEKMPDERFLLAGERGLFTPASALSVDALEFRLRLGTGGPSPPIAINENIGVANVVEAACEDGESYQVVVNVDVGTGDLQDVTMITIDPHIGVKNLTGVPLEIRQAVVGHDGSIDGHHATSLSDPNEVAFNWARGSSAQSGGMVQIREVTGSSGEGMGWSSPFRVAYPGGVEFFLPRDHAGAAGLDVTVRAFRIVVQLQSPGQLRIQIETAFARPQYAIVNLTSKTLHYRQSGIKGDGGWRSVSPNSSHSYVWEIPHGDEMIELRGGDAADVHTLSLAQENVSSKRKRLKLDKLDKCTSSLKEDNGIIVLRLIDDRDGEDAESSSQIDLSTSPEGLNSVSIAVQIFALTVSVVDRTPSELILCSVEELMAEYSTSRFDSRIGFRVRSIQVDDQLRHSQSPTMLLHFREEGRLSDDFIKGSIIIGGGGHRRVVSMPYLGLEQSGKILLSIYEPVIWRLLEFATNCAEKVSSAFQDNGDQGKIEVSDRMVQVSTLTLPDMLVRFSYRTSVVPIERGELSGFASVGLSLANIEGAKISVRGLTLENVTMPESALAKMLLDNIVKQLMGQSLTLLTNYAYLDNTSKALSQASTGLAMISMDENYQKQRQLATTSQVGGFADGIKDGSEALAKGIFHGVTGIFTKPIEGAKRQGLKGFVKGVGKGVIGAAAKPAAGAFDFASKTTEGISATVETLSAGLSDNVKVGGRERKRLSRAISGDHVIRPFSEYDAIGQHVLWACEQGTYFGKNDIFKTKGDFGNDRYETHMEVEDDHVFLLTNCRAMLLKRSKRGSILHYPCRVVWTVVWNEILSIELRAKVGEPPATPSSFVILLKDADGAYASKGKSPEHVIECYPRTTQAVELRLLSMKVMSRFYQGSLGQRTKSSSGDIVASATAAAGASAGAIIGATVFAPIAPISIPVGVALGSVIGGYSGLTSTAGSQRKRRKSTNVMESSEPDLVANESVAEEGANNLFLHSTTSQMVWCSDGIHGREVSIWRPVGPPGFVALSDTLQTGFTRPSHSCLMLKLDLKVRVGSDFVPAIRCADGYELLWRSTHSGSAQSLTIWRPVPPEDYVALGCTCVPYIEHPHGAQQVTYCVHKSLVYRCSPFDSPLWEFKRAHKSSGQIALHQIDNSCASFFARRAFDAAPEAVYDIDTDIFVSRFIEDTQKRGLARALGTEHKPLAGDLLSPTIQKD